jgi:hypothetical protein
MSVRPGEHVFWWKRVSAQVEVPVRAKVVEIGPKLVTIAVEGTEDTRPQHRRVRPDRLQPTGGHFIRARGSVRSPFDPTAAWGPWTVYLEIGEELWPVREVEVFDNGEMLSYDCAHWVDGFGMLNCGRHRRPGASGGLGDEIGAEEFERVWATARRSATWPRQVAAARMDQMGRTPVWMVTQG